MIDNFDELIKNGIHVVDFYANWCGPCKIMSKTLEEIEDKINIIKVDTDQNLKLVMQYRIMSIPTFLVFKNGKNVNMTVGVQDKEEILNLL